MLLDVKLAEETADKLDLLGLTTRAFPTMISYGVEANGDSSSRSFARCCKHLVQLLQRAIDSLGPDRFITCVQKINNNVGNFYKPKK